MLEAAEVVAFLPSLDLERSERFFHGELNLPVVSRSPFATVFSVGAATLRVTKVEELRPQPFTVLGWHVVDIRSALRELAHLGTVILRYEGMDQDEDGVWRTPSGELVAWIQDPDANVLSLTQLTSS